MLPRKSTLVKESFRPVNSGVINTYVNRGCANYRMWIRLIQTLHVHTLRTLCGLHVRWSRPRPAQPAGRQGNGDAPGFPSARHVVNGSSSRHAPIRKQPLTPTHIHLDTFTPATSPHLNIQLCRDSSCS